MNSWKLSLGVLCGYGFMKEMRPIEPFLTPYLMDDKNFTEEQLNAEIYPYATYSYLVILLPVFIFTDLLRYKPVIVSEGLAYLATWLLLTLGTTVGQMQAMQLLYGWATATEVAYYAYIYAAIHQRHYKKATSYVRGAVLLGRCVAYTLSQVIVSELPGQHMLLNCISLAAMAAICLIALFLPSTARETRQMYDVKWRETVAKDDDVSEIIEAETEGIREYFKNQFNLFLTNYSDPFVLKWSVWWAFATCGFFQIGNYIQTMWAVIYGGDSSPELYNGLTEAVHTFLGATVALSVQFLAVDWAKWGELTLGLISLLDCALLVIISRTTHLALAYILYVLFGVLYQLLITVATYNVASRIVKGSYALTIGCNTFLALLFQTILTFVVADEHGLDLGSRVQFLVYGVYFGAIALVFLLMGFLTLSRSRPYLRQE